MRHSAYLLILLTLPLLLSCRGGKGKVRIEGSFQNLNQADFLIYSPDGGFDNIDTLHLQKGKFRKKIAVSGGPYTFTIIYPNFSTLSFTASERDKVVIEGDALALADVKVEGADSVIVGLSTRREEKLKVGMRLPHVDVIEKSREDGKYLLLAFWANWRGGGNAVNTFLRRSMRDYESKLTALSYNLDVDPHMREIAEGREEHNWDTYCDYLAWDSPAISQLGINNIPFLILVDPDGKIVALGSNFSGDIEPELKKLKEKDPSSASPSKKK